MLLPCSPCKSLNYYSPAPSSNCQGPQIALVELMHQTLSTSELKSQALRQIDLAFKLIPVAKSGDARFGGCRDVKLDATLAAEVLFAV